MRGSTFSITLAIVLAASVAFPHSAHALRPGGIGPLRTAEQLGLQAAAVDKLQLNTPVTFTVVSPEKLAKQGLEGLKAGQEVQVTLLEGNRVKIVPITKTMTGKIATSALRNTSLLLSFDAKGTIAAKQLVPLDARLPASAAIQLRQ